MTAPRFSVVIPTRERPRTLGSAIESALAQRGDVEVLVVDNASGPETAAVIGAFDDPRLRSVRAERRLAMSDNWELGLSHARGELVFVLGDDDALLPDATRRVEAALALDPAAEVVSWRKNVTFWWTDAIVPHHRGRLYVDYEARRADRLVEARPRLVAHAEGDLPFDELPGIYTSFVRRSLVDRVAARHGRYFLTALPDVFSGIANAFHLERYVELAYGASIAGISGASTGTSQMFPNLGSESHERFEREHADGLSIHESLVPSRSIEILIADQNLRVAELFDMDDALRMKIPAVLGLLLGGMTAHPDLYDKKLEEARALAKKHRLKFPDHVVPPRQPIARTPRGVAGRRNGVLLTFDTEIAGLADAASAARLAAGLLPGP